MAIISGAYIIYLWIAFNLHKIFRQTTKRSAKCKRPSAKWRNAPRNARDLSPNGKTLREMQETFRQTAKRSAKCKRPSAKRRNAPRNARGLPPNGERLREMQETFRQMANISAKCKRGRALSGRGADYFVPFIASSSSIKSDVLLRGGTLCWPPSLPWLRSQSKKRPGRAGMISGGWREISL